MWRDLFCNASKNIFRKKARSFLTILGITIGVLAVITVSNINKCGSVAVNMELTSLGMDSLIVNTNNSLTNSVSLTEAELKTIRSIPNVKEAAPVIALNTQIYDAQTKLDAFVLGIDANTKNIISLDTIHGRFVSSKDVHGNENVCVMDQSTARSVFGTELVVGKNISIIVNGMNDKYKIIGIVKTGGAILDSCIGDNLPNFVYVPYTTLQNYVGNGFFDRIIVKSASNENTQTIGESIVSKLNAEAGIPSAYKVSNMSKQKDILSSVLNIITVILSSVGLVSLIVANLSIMTVMLVSVNERKKEIGIKKSLGATRTTILIEFLFEAFILSFIGCIIGVILSLGMTHVIAKFVTDKFYSSPDVIICAVAFSLTTGLIFGVYPAIKASKLKPIEALRSL